MDSHFRGNDNSVFLTFETAQWKIIGKYGEITCRHYDPDLSGEVICYINRLLHFVRNDNQISIPSLSRNCEFLFADCLIADCELKQARRPAANTN